MRHIKTLLLAMLIAFAATSCSKEQDYSSTSVIAGDYVGTVTVLGYNEEPARAYATVLRKSSDVVSFQLKCETFDLDLTEINLVVEKRREIIYLTSESTYAVEGSISAGVMSVSFMVGDYVYVFTGRED